MHSTQTPSPRRRIRGLWLGLAALVMSGVPAFATATVTCDINDKFVAFSLQAIASSAGPIVQVQQGTIRIKRAAGAALSAPNLTFNQSHIVQQWAVGDAMNLQIEVGNEKARENVNLVILTKPDKNTDQYNGGYVLTISRAGETKTFKGRVKGCEAG